jgi:hypothetical protein
MKKKLANTKAKSTLMSLINKATGIPPKRRGLEPERFKIEGYTDWKDAVKTAMAKRKPPGGWPKR